MMDSFPSEQLAEPRTRRRRARGAARSSRSDEAIFPSNGPHRASSEHRRSSRSRSIGPVDTDDLTTTESDNGRDEGDYDGPIIGLRQSQSHTPSLASSASIHSSFSFTHPSALSSYAQQKYIGPVPDSDLLSLASQSFHHHQQQSPNSSILSSSSSSTPSSSITASFSSSASFHQNHPQFLQYPSVLHSGEGIVEEVVDEEEDLNAEGEEEFYSFSREEEEEEGEELGQDEEDGLSRFIREEEEEQQRQQHQQIQLQLQQQQQQEAILQEKQQIEQLKREIEKEKQRQLSTAKTPPPSSPSSSLRKTPLLPSNSPPIIRQQKPISSPSPVPSIPSPSPSPSPSPIAAPVFTPSSPIPPPSSSFSSGAEDPRLRQYISSVLVQLERSQAAITRLTSENKSLEAQLQTCQREAFQIRSQVPDLHEHILALQAKLQDSKSGGDSNSSTSLQALRDKMVSGLREETQQLRQYAYDSSASLQEMKKQMEAVQSDHNAHITALRTECERLGQELAQSQVLSNSRNRTISELQSELQTTRLSLSEQITALSQRLTLKASECEEMSKKVQESEEQVKLKQQECEELRKTTAESVLNAKSFAEHARQLEDRCKSSAATIENLSSRISDLQSSNPSSSSSSSLLLDHSSVSAVEIDKLRSAHADEISALNDKIDSISAQLQSEKQRVNREAQEKDLEIASLTDACERLSEYIRKGSSSSSSSSSGIAASFLPLSISQLSAPPIPTPNTSKSDVAVQAVDPSSRPPRKAVAFTQTIESSLRTPHPSTPISPSSSVVNFTPASLFAMASSPLSPPPSSSSSSASAATPSSPQTQQLIRQLRDECARLQQVNEQLVKTSEDATRSRDSMALERSVLEAEIHRLREMAAQLSSLEEKQLNSKHENTSIAKELAAIKEKLNARESDLEHEKRQKNELLSQLDAARNSLADASVELERRASEVEEAMEIVTDLSADKLELQTQLAEAEAALRDNRSALQALEKQLQDAHMLSSQKDADMARLQGDLSSLKAKEEAAIREMERVQHDLFESSQRLSDASFEKNELFNKSTTAQALVQSLEREVHRLRAEVTRLESTVAQEQQHKEAELLSTIQKLQKELNASQANNGDLERKVKELKEAHAQLKLVLQAREQQMASLNIEAILEEQAVSLSSARQEFMDERQSLLDTFRAEFYRLRVTYETEKKQLQAKIAVLEAKLLVQ